MCLKVMRKNIDSRDYRAISPQLQARLNAASVNPSAATSETDYRTPGSGLPRSGLGGIFQFLAQNGKLGQAASSSSTSVGRSIF
jgi:hypothetical protein